MKLYNVLKISLRAGLPYCTQYDDFVRTHDVLGCTMCRAAVLCTIRLLCTYYDVLGRMLCAVIIVHMKDFNTNI